MGPPAFDYPFGRIWDAPDSTLDFRAEHSAAYHGRIFDSVHGARRMGSCASALERTFAAGISRDLSRTRLSAGKFRRRVCRPTTGLVGRAFPPGKRTTKLRAHHGAGGSDRFSGGNFPRRDRTRRARQRILTAFSLPVKMRPQDSYFSRSSWLTQLLQRPAKLESKSQVLERLEKFLNYFEGAARLPAEQNESSGLIAS